MRQADRHFRWVAGALAVLLVAILAVLDFLHIPYYELTPGPTAPVSELITVPKAEHHAVHGTLLLVTVYQTQLTTLGLLRAKLGSDNEVFTAAQILGNVPASQLLELDEAEMEQSQQAAAVAALRRLGYSVTEHGTGVLVVATVAGSPSASKLRAGDTIRSIDGQSTPTDTALVADLAKDHPGQSVVLVVQNEKGVSRTMTITLTARPGEPKVGFLGIETLTRDDSYSLPFKVSINSEGIGGPSAGLSFTLGIIDILTGGHLTGGHVMAATGTIDVDGNVGDVGGVAEKTVSVSRAGATLFLVPPQEYATAKAHAGPHLKVVAVSTLDQALAAIAANGGNLSGLPSPPSGVR